MIVLTGLLVSGCRNYRRGLRAVYSNQIWVSVDAVTVTGGYSVFLVGDFDALQQ